jgi:ATP-binding cassette subfamily B protein
MRLYSPPKRTVLLNGKDVAEYKLDELRGVYGYVPQEPFLFSMTIKDNIRFARPEMDDEEVVYWAKKAFIHDDIMRFKDGYDTWVGERGVTLSGGQKQRIAIARALSLCPRILVLDDALSAVDAETESEILKELGEIRGKATNIIIAHRLSAVKNADRTIVLNNGKIEDIGTHEELKERSPYYKELYMLQSAVIEEGK